MGVKRVIWDHRIGNPDCKAGEIANRLIEKDEIRTGNWLVLENVKLLVATDVLDDVVLIFDGEEYPINEYGVIVDGPSFADAFSASERLLRAATNKKAAKREERSIRDKWADDLDKKP